MFQMIDAIEHQSHTSFNPLFPTCKNESWTFSVSRSEAVDFLGSDVITLPKILQCRTLHYHPVIIPNNANQAVMLAVVCKPICTQEVLPLHINLQQTSYYQRLFPDQKARIQDSVSELDPSSSSEEFRKEILFSSSDHGIQPHLLAPKLERQHL